MLTGKESKDELLAQWAELLRTRYGLQVNCGSQHVVRYFDERGTCHEYVCQSDDMVLINEVAALFRKDVDQRLAILEDTLKAHNIAVSRG